MTETTPISEAYFPFPTRLSLQIDSILASLDKDSPEHLPNPEQLAQAKRFETALTRGELGYTHQENSLASADQNGTKIAVVGNSPESTIDIPVLPIEQIYENKIHTLDFYLTPLLTPENKTLLAQALNQPQDYFSDQDQPEIESFLINFDYTSLTDDQLSQLEQIQNDTQSAAIETARDEILSLTDFSQAAKTVEFSPRVTVIIDPNAALERYQQLKDLKQFHKTLRSQLVTDLQTNSGDPQLTHAKLTLLDIHRRRTNELIAITTRRLHQHSPKNLSRYDKFIHGSADIEDGDFTPTSQDILQLADTILQTTIDQTPEQSAHTRFSPEEVQVLQTIKIDAQEAHDWFVQLLDENDLLADDQTPRINPNTRVNNHPTQHWQVIIDPSKESSIGVSASTGQVRISPSFKRSLGKTSPKCMAATLAHEFKHVRQALAQLNDVDLALAENVGTSEQESIHKEAGAVLDEDDLLQDFYRRTTVEKPYLVAALQARMSGGNFIDCAMANFHARKAIDPSRSDKSLLKSALKNTLRIFEYDPDLNSKAPFPSNTQPMYYLEQIFITSKLLKSNHAYLLSVGGIDLNTASKLKQIGMLNVGKLFSPKVPAKDILYRLVRQKLDQHLQKQKTAEST